MKKPARFLSLLMAVMMLVGSAVPAYAFEGLGEISNITDYGEDTPVVTEDEEDPPTLEEGEMPDKESPSSSEPQPDASEPPVVDTGEPPEESEGETLPGEPDDPLPSEPTVGASGLDPPDSFSFEAVRSGSASPFGMRKARANPGSTTIYIEKISGLSHLYPFSGGTTYKRLQDVHRRWTRRLLRGACPVQYHKRNRRHRQPQLQRPEQHPAEGDRQGHRRQRRILQWR